MKIKICGVTHPDDAEVAAHLGADYIGIIFSTGSRRRVSVPLAKRIATAAKHGGAEPVGVFVEEPADQIAAICELAGIKWIQLHGSRPTEDLDLLIGTYLIIQAISVEKDGSVSQHIPPLAVTPLYDNLKAGCGTPFDWAAFSPPKKSHWILAGGLNPGNVAEAIALLKPYGVDVATGVELSRTTRKDPYLVKAFIQTARELQE